MLSKFFTLIFAVAVFSAISFGQAVVFEDNFDSYTAGIQAACQNPTDWTTWSNAPCGAEDPMISSTYSSSPSNSVHIIANNDFVHVFPNYTTGKWSISFKLYIATGNTAYFNTLSEFAGGSSQWAMQVYFNNGGLGNLDAGVALAQPFTYSYDTWMDVEVVANLDGDVGEFWLNGTMIYTWQWSLGTFGTGILQLGGSNFYGGGTDGIPDYYMDDYTFTDLLAPPPPTGFFDDMEAYTPGTGLACQNTTEWDTWSNAPCGSEDPLVSNLYAYSGSNSTVVIQNNDLIRHHGPLTSGKWYLSFWVYIPAGKAGYFNNMSSFGATNYWVMDVYFDVGGTGRLLTGDPDVNFTWTADTWQFVQCVIDLDTDQGQFSLNGNLIHTWPWTSGSSGGTGPLALDVTDLFGATANDQMYFDDFYFNDVPVPVELTSFTADVNNAGNVVLNWTTATEVNNQMFEIERRSQEGEYFRIGYVNGHGTTTEGQEYSYVDNSVETGTYFYRLKQIDFNGRYEYSDAVEVEVKGPLAYGLEQNYPNPFNPSTNIKFSILESGLVRLSVYNLIGEEVTVLVNEQVEAGFYEVNFDASALPSGAYFYKLQAGNTVQVKKMLLMK
jgi:hypothetical protein